MTFPGAQILQAGSWKKLCENRMKNVALAFQQPQAMPSFAHPACPDLLQQPAKGSGTFPSRLLENGASMGPFGGREYKITCQG